MSLVGKSLGWKMSWLESVPVGKCPKWVKVLVGKSLVGKFLVGKCLVGKCLVGKRPGTVTMSRKIIPKCVAK